MKKVSLASLSSGSKMAPGRVTRKLTYGIITAILISCFVVYHFLIVHQYHLSTTDVVDNFGGAGGGQIEDRSKLRGWPTALQSKAEPVMLILPKHNHVSLDGDHYHNRNSSSIYVPPANPKSSIKAGGGGHPPPPPLQYNNDINSISNSNSNNKDATNEDLLSSSGGLGSNSNSNSNINDNINSDRNKNILLDSPSDKRVVASSSNIINYKRSKDVRIAVIIPYFGLGLPAWFDMFVFQSRVSSDLVDWLIFINDAELREVPDNIKLIKVTKESFCDRLAKLDESVGDLLDDPSAQFCNLITKQPYTLVEFKPSLGFLFEDYLHNYSHWALGDIDLMPGRLGHLIDSATLKAFDIVTLSFGDNFRMYMRGQLTIHKNNKKVNNIWKKCKHLSNIGGRLREFSESSRGHWHFESAEGCYSKVVSQSKLKVLVSNTQITDAFGAPLDEKESLYLGPALMRCYEKPLSFREFNKFIKPIYSSGYADDDSDEESDVDALAGEFPTRLVDYKCSYWVNDAYQVCLDTVPADVDIISNQQILSYRKEEKYLIVNGRCREGGVSHFQGWKERFHPYTTRAPSMDAHAILITDIGFIPLVVKELQGYSYGEITGMHTPLGLLSPLDTNVNKRDKIPFHIDRFNGISTSYCIGFARDLKKCFCPLSGDKIEVIQISDQTRNTKNTPAITLITVAWSTDFYEKKLDKLLDSWTGFKIIVLAHSKRSSKRKQKQASHRSDVTIVEVNIGDCEYIDKIDGNIVLPDSALYNIGMDIATTDAIALAPPSTTFRTFNDAHQGLIVDNNYVSNQYVAEKLLLQMDQIEFTSGENIAILFGHFISFNNLDEDERVMYKKENKGFTEFSKKMADKRGTDKGIDQKASINYRNLIPFPLPQISSTNEKSCGVQQPGRLLLSFEDRLEHFNNPFPAAIDFNAQDFLKSRTLMTPFAFKRSSSPHGTHFARFPEEFNGPGCYGSSILRVLAGSGYSLYWSNELFVEEIEFKGDVGEREEGDRERDNGGMKKYTVDVCECASVADPNDLREFGAKLNKYFYRAIELRNSGITSVYSRSKFGANFEKEQEDLLAEPRGEEAEIR